MRPKSFVFGIYLYCCIPAMLMAFGTNFSHTGKPTDENRYIKKAQKSFQHLEFEKAGEYYQKALDINPGSVAANFEMGLYQSQIKSNHKKALEFYEVAEKSMSNDTIYELFYYLGSTHHLLGNYQKAIDYYTLFKSGISKKGNGETLRLLIDDKMKQCEFALNKPKPFYSANAVNVGSGINTNNSEYCSVWLKSDSAMVFTRRSNDNLGTYSFDNKFHEDIYVSQYKNSSFIESKPIQEDQKLKSILNTKYHDAIVETSLTNDTLIIFKEKKLWYSIYKSGALTEPQPFTKEINFANYQRHACFSADGKSIYFSSDDKNGKGGYDLYKSILQSNGEWGTPVNLGDSINTEKDEDSPYLSADGKKLFFASKGHLGFGGYDVFCSSIKENSMGKPVNLGPPVNSPADDIYFSFTDKYQTQAYISSSRVEGFGHMDIYSVQMAPTPPSYCITTDSFPHHSKMTIVLTDTVAVGELVNLSAEASFKQAGIDQITWQIQPDNNSLKGQSINYTFNKPCAHTVTAEFKVIDSTFKTNWRYCTSKTITVVSPEDMVKTDERIDVDLENVYFDFDKFNIRTDADASLQRNIEKIKKFSSITIKLVAHTDSKGSNEYNVRLSKRRAKSVARYLAAQGIDVSKTFEIEWKGEESPAAENANADGSDNPEGRQKNRRVEFIVIKK